MERLDLHCEECDTHMCCQCSMHGNHRFHPCRHAETKFDELKKAILPLREQTEKLSSMASDILTQLNMSQEKLMQQKAQVQHEINQGVSRVHQLLEKRSQELLAELDKVSFQHEELIASGKEQLNDTIVKASSCLESVMQNLANGSVAGVSELVGTATEDLSRLVVQAKPLPDIQCRVSSKELAGNLEEWCIHSQEVCPANCFVEGGCMKSTWLNDVAELDLYTRNYDNQPCVRTVQCEAIQCEVTHDEVMMRGSVRCCDDGNNHFRISYTPVVSGNLQMDVSVDGMSIRGSPFQVTALDVLHPTSSISNVQGPWGVAINQEGQIIVAENGGNCISIFDKQRKRVHKICDENPSHETKGLLVYSQGEKPHEMNDYLNHASEVAVDHQGNILVANRFQHNVIKFHADGTFVRRSKNDFYYPTGISVNPINDKLYVADTFGHRIKVLNTDLTHDVTFGEYGGQKGAEFVYPTSVACNSTGKVYVVDNGNHRIQTFTADGHHVSSFGQYGSKDGEFIGPVGIAVDGHNKLYVSDRGNHRICIFTSEGCFLSAFYSSAKHDFDPSALAVDDHFVYVSSHRQGQVHLFHL